MIKKIKKLNLGVIGLGRIGWSYHCPEISKSKYFNLVAVADPVPERLKDAEEKFKGVKTFLNYKDLIKQANLDLVVIATPTHLHKPMAMDAFKQGLGVIMEKPICSNLKEAKALVASAKKHKAFLTTYQPHRLGDYFQHVTQLIKEKEIGEVYLIKIGRYRFVRRNDWQSLQKFGGGQLKNTGAHVIDQVVSLLGNNIKEVYCQRRMVATLGDADDALKIICTNEKGMTCEVDINHGTLHNDKLMVVFGTDGLIELPNTNEIIIKKLIRKSLKKIKLDSSMASANRRYPRDQYKTTEKTIKVKKSLEVDFYKNIYENIRFKKELFIKPEQTISVMEVLEKCSKQGKLIDNRV